MRVLFFFLTNKHVNHPCHVNQQVKRVESANQLSMKVASDDEDDAVDQLLEHQHQMIMRSSSAYSLASNPDSSSQV